LLMFAPAGLRAQKISPSSRELFWSAPLGEFYPEALKGIWAESRAYEIVAAMSDEELLSQILMLGYPGTEAPKELLDWISTRGLGGVKIFGRNSENTEVLVHAIADFQRSALSQKQAIPLLVATDQEGGWIRHVKGRSSESPGNMAIGATASSRDAYLSGYYIGREMRNLGISMNFAPDIDLATAPESSIIGPRAFSDDPALVSRLGLAWARGSLDAGVIPTAKHFPGHGATPLDSHGILPRIEIDRTIFIKRELAPFLSIARAGFPAIMSGHLAFPKISGDVPASLSPEMIEGYLRNFLGFKGLVITDDLYMAGALGEEGILETCLKALRAGNDMLLLSVAPDENGRLWRGLLTSLKSDKALRARIEESVRRILMLKLLYLGAEGRKAVVPKPEVALSSLPDPEAGAFFRDLARRSVSVVGRSAKLPFLPEGKVLIASPFGDFLTLGRERFPDSKSFQFSYRPEQNARPEELTAFKETLRGCAAAIVCVANRAGMQFAAAAHEAGVDVAIVSVLSPIHAAHAPWAKAVLAVYYYANICLEAGLDALRGHIVPKGKVPLADRHFR